MLTQTFLNLYTYEIDKLEPTVAKPFSPDNISAARELQGVEIDKAYIGSCTGAKLEDLRLSAKLLKGKKVKVRTEVLPGSSINLHKGHKRRSGEYIHRSRCSSRTARHVEPVVELIWGS